MKRFVLLAALVATASASCESAAKHPAITIGTVVGTMGFGLCELSVGHPGTCAIVGGTAALALGGITALVTLLANTNASDESLPDPALDQDQDHGQIETVTEPPPGLPAWMGDAGVGSASTVDAAATDAM